MTFMLSIPKLPRPSASPTRCRIHAGRTALLGCLAALVFSAPMSAQCVQGPIGGMPPFEPDVNGLNAQIDGGDLIVDVELGDGVSTARLRLLGAGGRTLAEKEVPAAADGRSSVTLPGALLRGRHPQMQVQIFDGVDGELLIEEALRIRVDCGAAGTSGAAEGPCRRTVQQGLRADSAVLDPRLAEAFQELRAAGRSDALAILFDREPTWRGSLADLALSWKAGDIYQGPADQGPVDQGPVDQGPSDQGPGDREPTGKPGQAGPGDIVNPAETGSCRCSWVAIEQHTAVTRSGLPVGSPPRHTRQWWSGADGWWATQMTGSQLTSTVSPRQTTLGFQLVCGRLRGAETRELDIDGHKERIVLPVISACEASCSPSVDYEIETGLCIDAKGYGAGDRRVDAALDIESNVWIDGDFVAGSRLTDQLRAEDPAGVSFQQVGGPVVSRSVSRFGSAAKIHTRAAAQLDIEASSSSQAYLFASMRSRTKARVEATCGPAKAILTHGTNVDTGGGKLIVRWGDPP